MRVRGVARLVLPGILLAGLIAAVACAGAARADEVALESAGSTYRVPVIVNGAVKIAFVLDSGASDLLIPADTVLTLMRSGTLSAGDFVGNETYRLADGRTLQSRKFTLHEVRVGGVTLQNVVALVGPVTSAPLLGQSFLSRLGSWTIDNARHVLVFSALPGQASSPSAGNRTLQQNKTAAAGMPMRLNSALSLNPDCSVIGIPVGRLTQAPLHGTIRFIRQDVFPDYVPSNPRSRCNTVKFPAITVEYTSFPGYIGSDAAVVEIISPDGKDTEIKYAIAVK